MDNEKYVRGFNHAFLLKQYKPEVLKQILSTSSDNDYIQGLKDGERSVQNQKVKSRTQEIKELKSRNRDLDLER